MVSPVVLYALNGPSSQFRRISALMTFCEECELLARNVGQHTALGLIQSDDVSLHGHIPYDKNSIIESVIIFFTTYHT